MYCKITYGWVSQLYNDNGKCMSQEFIAGNQTEREDFETQKSRDNSTTLNREVYQPYTMVQPTEDRG